MSNETEDPDYVKKKKKTLIIFCIQNGFLKTDFFFCPSTETCGTNTCINLRSIFCVEEGIPWCFSKLNVLMTKLHIDVILHVSFISCNILQTVDCYSLD